MTTTRKTNYAASVNLSSTTLNSLAASSTLLAGAELAEIDNSTNKYDDYIIGGHVKAGAANTQIGFIEIWAVAEEEDGTRPDQFTGTPGARSITSNGVKFAICKSVWVITTEAVNDRIYYFSGVSLKDVFRGTVPRKCAIFVTHTAHTSTNAIASSGHSIDITGVYYTDE